MRSTYTKLKDKLSVGQWIFTCSMEPQQFKEISPRDPIKWEWDRSKYTQEEWDDMVNDDFITINGSHHSFFNCSCKPITEAYALWFLENKISSLYDICAKEDLVNAFVLYENKVKELAEIAGLEYEGI